MVVLSSAIKRDKGFGAVVVVYHDARLRQVSSELGKRLGRFGGCRLGRFGSCRHQL